MFTVLVCEDEKNIRHLMTDCLLQAGYTVLQAVDGEEALQVLDKSHVDLLITDIMMPGIDGFTLTADLRAAGYELPILMVTAKEAFDDKKHGFSIGADDYMVKPIDMDEMVVRVAALLRRAKISYEKQIVIGDTYINYDTLSISFEDQTIELPKKEFLLLFKLLSHPKRIFTRKQLMDEIWGPDADSDERTVDVHIKRLRDKLGSISAFEIFTVRGLGYKAVKKE